MRRGLDQTALFLQENSKLILICDKLNYTLHNHFGFDDIFIESFEVFRTRTEFCDPIITQSTSPVNLKNSSNHRRWNHIHSGQIGSASRRQTTVQQRLTKHLTSHKSSLRVLLKQQLFLFHVWRNSLSPDIPVCNGISSKCSDSLR